MTTPDSLLARSFVQAKYYTRGPRTKGGIGYIVIHDMEAPEGPTTAENVASYFTHPLRPSSAHWNIDNNSIVQSVKETDIAWHCPGLNHNGIGIEHAGYARQTAAEWADPYSTATLTLSAALAAERAAHWDIPTVWRNAKDLRAGKRGFTSHREGSIAFNPGGHSDPGPNFPIDWYMGKVTHSSTPPPVPPASETAPTAIAQKHLWSLPDGAIVQPRDNASALRLATPAQVQRFVAAGWTVHPHVLVPWANS